MASFPKVSRFIGLLIDSMKTTMSRLIGIALVSSLMGSVAANAQTFVVKSVGSVRKYLTATTSETQVHVVFSKAVDATTGTTPANYTFGGGIAVTGAQLITGLPGPALADVAQNPAPFGRVFDNECVLLTVTGLAPDATASVTIQGVTSAVGDALPSTTVNFKDSGHTWVDIGVHPLAGKVIAISTNGFDVYSSGTTQWSDEDQVTFVYKNVTGDFDLQARVEFQDFSSRWGRAGVMAREALNVGENATTQDTTASRYADMHANPAKCWNDSSGGIATANNQYEAHRRSETGGETSSAGGATPLYPDAWVRLQRTAGDVASSRSDDGVTWTEMNTAFDTTQAQLFVGFGFSPEIGNINAANPADAKNRLFLAQYRFGKVPYPSSRFDWNPSGLLITITDAETAVDPATVKLSINGTQVTISTNKTGAITTVVNSQTNPFPVGSTNIADLEFKTTTGITIRPQSSWVANYKTVPASYALAAPATGAGMNYNAHFLDTVARGPGDANSPGNAEQQILAGFIDPTSGQPYPNGASPPSGTISSGVVNWDQAGADIDATPENGPDNFNSVLPVAGPVPNDGVPGISGGDWMAVEALTYLQLTRGAYRMGVNSDDGFRVTAGLDSADRFGIELGAFNTGRGAGDTLFDFYVAADGYYPFRLLWWEGTGDGNAEWFVVNLSTGVRSLVNGAGAGTVKGYLNGSGRAHIRSLLPANGFTGAAARPTITAQFANGRTSVKASSISLVVDGNTVLSGQSGPSVSWTAPADLAYASVHTGSIVWTETTVPETVWTNSFTFTIKPFSPDVLPAASFWIEAEDYNYGSGQTLAAASTMPYTGDAYTGLEGVRGVDYNDDPVADNAITEYRMVKDVNGAAIPIPVSNGRYGIDRPGTVDMTVNYRIGWVGAGDWYNYTRTIPAGTYTAFAALSQDAGTMNARLEQVTSPANVPNQTVQVLGTFTAPASGAWGDNNLLQMIAPDGSTAVFKIRGTAPTTLRFNGINGDFDWFVVVPAIGAPPKVTSASPANNAAVRRDASLSFTIEDFSTAVVQSSVRLIVDGADVTSSATITKPADITTVTYDPPGLMGIASSHSYSLIFTDNGTPAVTRTNSANFTVHVYPTAGSFLIEAEDFNSGGGQTVAAASTMPYLGGVYTNLGAVLGVDYNDTDGRDSQPYRGSIGNGTAGQNVNHDSNATAGTLDTDRGEWSVTANYKIGWTGAGNWYNYTRTIPANTYQVWAALSFDGTTAGQLNARLEQVSGDVTTTNQTLTVLGIFDAPGSGGWGANNLVQMKDPGGSVPAVVSLSGVQTLRFNPISGDFDYFLLVPGAPPLRLNPPTLSGGQATISWTGTGTLQQSDSLTTPNWTTAPSQANPQTVTASGASKYYRLQQ
jgi:hypothetical protein